MDTRRGLYMLFLVVFGLTFAVFTQAGDVSVDDHGVIHLTVSGQHKTIPNGAPITFEGRGGYGYRHNERLMIFADQWTMIMHGHGMVTDAGKIKPAYDEAVLISQSQLAELQQLGFILVESSVRVNREQVIKSEVIVIHDDAGSEGDLSGKTDIDDPANRRLLFRWVDSATEQMTHVNNYHVYISRDSGKNFLYAGQVGKPKEGFADTYFVWEEGNTQLSPEFLDGPQDGEKYVARVIKQGFAPHKNRVWNSGEVTFRTQVDVLENTPTPTNTLAPIVTSTPTNVPTDTPLPTPFGGYSFMVNQPNGTSFHAAEGPINIVITAGHDNLNAILEVRPVVQIDSDVIKLASVSQRYNNNGRAYLLHLLTLSKPTNGTFYVDVTITSGVEGRPLQYRLTYSVYGHPEPTSTPTATATVTATSTLTPTVTATSEATNAPTTTSTDTPLPTSAPTVTWTPTIIAEATATPVATATNTQQPSPFSLNSNPPQGSTFLLWEEVILNLEAWNYFESMRDDSKLITVMTVSADNATLVLIEGSDSGPVIYDSGVQRKQRYRVMARGPFTITVTLEDQGKRRAQHRLSYNAIDPNVTPTLTPTVTVTATATSTATTTATLTSTPISTNTPTPSATATVIADSTSTPTATATSTPTATATSTPTVTPVPVGEQLSLVDGYPYAPVNGELVVSGASLSGVTFTIPIGASAWNHVIMYKLTPESVVKLTAGARYRVVFDTDVSHVHLVHTALVDLSLSNTPLWLSEKQYGEEGKVFPYIAIPGGSNKGVSLDLTLTRAPLSSNSEVALSFWVGYNSPNAPLPVVRNMFIPNGGVKLYKLP